MDAQLSVVVQALYTTYPNSCSKFDKNNKQTDTFQYLHRNSSHPTASFRGMINKGEVLRYFRTYNNIDDFKKKNGNVQTEIT